MLLGLQTCSLLYRRGAAALFAAAYIVMAYTAMAYTVMTYIVMAYIVMAYTVMAYVVMAYTIMAYIVMAYTVMAYVVAVLFAEPLFIDASLQCRTTNDSCSRNHILVIKRCSSWMMRSLPSLHSACVVSGRLIPTQ